jgi:ArsR family transcriptional regulator
VTTNLATAVLLAKTLGHPARLRLLALLKAGPCSVCHMAAALGVPVSTASGHLLELRRAGLIAEERHGRWVCYSLVDDPATTAVVELLLTLIRTDPQVRADRAAAAALAGMSPSAACAAAGRARTVRWSR